MYRLYLFLFVSFVIPHVFEATSTSIQTSGVVIVDDLSFDKVISRFDAALVKFDVAYPYGDKHEAFLALARESKDVNELVVVDVGVKDYGVRDNEELAKKYGATKDNFPVVKLFLKGKSEPLTFDDSEGFTTDNLRAFVTKNTGVHLSLPGCVRQMDQVAIKFMKTPKQDDRKKLIKQAEEEAKALPEKDAPSAKIYKLIMQRILEKGDEFVNTEYQRVSKILGSKISDEKKNELVNRIHILHTFKLNLQKKEEL